MLLMLVMLTVFTCFFFFFKQKTAYEMRISDWSSDVCSSDLFGKVTNLTDYGSFVEVEAGIEGLVHVSEMDWTNKNVDPRKVVTLGEEVEVMVLEIDEDRRRISLGMKQCRANPWEEFSINFKRGDKVRGAVKSITDFGVFVGLPGGMDGRSE